MASPGWLTGLYEKVAMESSAQAPDSSTSSATPQPKAPLRKGHSGRGHRQITRNRASYSCHTCRRRKVKCDKVRGIFSEIESLRPTNLSLRATGPSSLRKLRQK